MFYLNLLSYILSFGGIWFGAGLIISAASKFSSRLKLAPFTFSFVFLGILTSIPEFSVGLQAAASRDPEIFAGNLLGGIVVLFLVVMPIMAIFGNGISLKNEMGNKTLLATLAVILTPSLLILDKKVTNLEGAFMILIYLLLLYLVQRKNGIFDRSNKQLMDLKAYSYKDLLKIIFGIVLVFSASSVIVHQTMYFAGVFNISAFYIGLLVIALGTDLPEIALSVRSVLSGKKELAMGDYIGAAAVSTFLFGLFTLLHNGEVLTVTNFLTTFIFIATALSMFYYFSWSKKFISRNNGILMFCVYLLFVTLEIMKK